MYVLNKWISDYVSWLIVVTNWHVFTHLHAKYVCMLKIGFGLCVDIIIRGQILINNVIFLYMQTPSALLNGMLCFRETFPVCTALRRLTRDSSDGVVCSGWWGQIWKVSQGVTWGRRAEVTSPTLLLCSKSGEQRSRRNVVPVPW